MAEVSVHPVGKATFRVEVRAGRTRTEHTVRVPPGYQTTLGCVGTDDATLVAASFAFLLEREPATSILGNFSLDQIAGYFPRYPAEISRRLASPSG